MNKEEAKINLKNLIDRYNSTVRQQDRKNISEETIRTWLNELLGIFGWNVQDTSQILQERVLDENLKQKLKSIDSTHTRPDYILKNGLNIKTFLDAKSLDVNIFQDKDAAFQIRSYGWSANVPCAFLSNFEQFSIYDTQNVPYPYDEAQKYTVCQLTIDDYLNNFDILYEHLNRDFVCSNRLETLYRNQDLQGTKALDGVFADTLNYYRFVIAEDIFENNKSLINSEERVNYYTQAILDRIIFIRVCEAKGIEKADLLKTFCNSPDGFWKNFKESCYMDFYNHYDGTLFEQDEIFSQIKLSDEILGKFIEQLYYPSAYRFEIMPVNFIAKIYEKFLGTRITIKSGIVRQELKPEYIKTNGAIPTPEHIVDMVCRQTIKLYSVATVDDLLNVKILDPCCGSGVFLVSCYDLLAEKFIKLVKESEAEKQKYASWFTELDGRYFLTIDGRRNLITHCLHGIDCDESAIEVSKMSLALKVVDGTETLYWNEIGAYGEKILRDISQNIKLGNTLVSEHQNFSLEELDKIKPRNMKQTFKDVFADKNGFDYIVGNPPYVETKFFKADSPAMHSYLSKRYKAFQQKADLAVLFLERSLDLLGEKGKAGFIIQKRWFKTEYGNAIRNIISENGYLDTLLDFSANDLFASKQTYVAILVLSKKKNAEFNYYLLDADKETVKNLFENADSNRNFNGCDFKPMPMPQKDSVWAFDDIMFLRERLTKEFGTVKQFPKLHIRDGIQALWKKAYHLKNVQFDGDIATGFNGFREKIEIEKSILRGVVYNKVFYPFKNIEPDAYCIFPYYGASNDIILINDLKENFPLAYKYFSDNETRIKGAVECPNSDEWYSFTREHNHTMYDVPKIILPMTAYDTIATYISDKGLYMDNSNVWFITVENASDSFMKALTAFINSTPFSVLAKAGANPQLNGYYKLNKQFLNPVPLPISKLQAENNIKKLSAYYDGISELQNKYISAVGSRKENIASLLQENWDMLDDFCNDLYGLSKSERKQINAVGRKNRIELIKQGA